MMISVKKSSLAYITDLNVNKQALLTEFQNFVTFRSYHNSKFARLVEFLIKKIRKVVFLNSCKIYLVLHFLSDFAESLGRPSFAIS